MTTMKTQRQLDTENLTIKLLIALTFGLLFALLFTGCTTAIIDAKKPVLNPKTGELAGEETARARVYVTGNGTQVIDKLRASNGKTLSIGASGIDQTSESDKLLDSIGTLLMRGLLASAGAPVTIPATAQAATPAVATPPASTTNYLSGGDAYLQLFADATRKTNADGTISVCIGNSCYVFKDGAALDAFLSKNK